MEDILFFFAPVGEQTIFFKKIPAQPPPPLNIKWSVPNNNTESRNDKSTNVTGLKYISRELQTDI